MGMRRCFRLLKKANPSAYRDTIGYFKPPKPVIALTIDDGLCRGGSDSSMANEVFALLKKYNAHATFFVCTNYVQDQEDTVRALFEKGHELGNHLKEDRLWYYPKLEQEEFQAELHGANAILDDLEERLGGAGPTASKTRWFRAPQGIMNEKMRQAVTAESTTTHVLGDCYCDDWCFAEEVDPFFDDKEVVHFQKLKKAREAKMKEVAKLMLSQAKQGSIAILHMPEKGFREGNLLALEYFLQGIQDKGWSCVNLTEMQELCDEEETTGGEEFDSDDNE